jgi:hypothetical protein
MQACRGIAQTGGIVAAASMALVSKGYGEVIRVQLDDYIPPDGVAAYDLDGDGDGDITFDTTNYEGYAPRMIAETYAYGGASHSCFIIVDSAVLATALDANVFINNMSPDTTGQRSGYLDNFYNQPSPRYAGFFFCNEAADTTLHQAWIELEVTGTAHNYGLNVIAYGYETEPLAGIFTGQPDPTAIGEPAALDAFALHQNVPNPFNPTTTIHYDVPEAGGKVTLRIFDVSGRLVRTLADGVETQGSKQATWDGRDDRGHRVATGVYFCRLTAPGFTKTRKMVLVQ